MKPSRLLPLALLAIACSACAEQATLTVEQGTGPKPQLPPPVKDLLPTVNIAKAVGWPAHAQPHTSMNTAPDT